MATRVPAIAIVALRPHIEQFLRREGELCDLNLDEMLLAGLRYVLDEHPCPESEGAVPAPRTAESVQAALEVFRALPDDVPTVDACLDALTRALDLEAAEIPCGRRLAPPQAYPYSLGETPEALRGVNLVERVYGLIAADGWLHDTARRDEVLAAVLPPNAEQASFIELDDPSAIALASALIARDGGPTSEKARRAAARAFVRLFGHASRCYTHADFDESTLENPFTGGSVWSRYSAADDGSWGSTLAIVVTYGMHAAYLEAVWDITSE